MSMTDVGDPTQSPGPGAGGGAPPGGPPGRPGGGGLGNVLAALQQNRQSAQPTAPGQGNMADSMNTINMAMQMMSGALAGLGGPQNPLFIAVTDALKRIQRHVAKGGPTLGTQQTGFMDMVRATKKNAMLQQIAQNQAQGGGQGGPQQPGMPATPLPGA